ncbi:hypothetical protein [Maribellus sediminis]|uniref:hypothetical protein n=1 Tax=Maribellus sediminis TaxID=2696285 RepID=UPI0014302CE5|nr:hypothetical protein [Maribellus sediminis]
MKSLKTNLIDESLIIKQIEKICLSDDFRTKDLLCKFLSYVVSEYLAGRAEKLKGYSIGVDVFGRNEDFDPSQDALVRIHAGRLRRMLDLFYLKEGKDDQIIIEIPKGGYTPFISLKKAIKKELVQTTEFRRKYSGEPKLAVFPFTDLTEDGSMHYFSRGITEELSVVLTKYEDISVYNFSAFSKENMTKNHLKKLVEKSGVRFILEGALNKAGDQIKILARLTDLSVGKQIWAESYSRKLNSSNTFVIQESVAKEIANVLCSEYGIILHQLTVDSYNHNFKDFETYDAVLKFYDFQLRLTQSSAEQAFEAITHVYEKNPESGLINALLAALHGTVYTLDYPNSTESYKLFVALAEKAKYIEPESFIVSAILATKCFVCNEKERFLDLAEKCLAIDPIGALRAGTLAFYLCLYGEWEKGKQMLDNIMHRNMSYPLYFHGCTMLYYYRTGTYDEALLEANKYNIPSVFWGPMLRAAVNGQLSNFEEASKQVKDLLELKPDFEKKAEYLISRYVKEESLVNHILEGLRLAGLKL